MLCKCNFPGCRNEATIKTPLARQRYAIRYKNENPAAVYPITAFWGVLFYVPTEEDCCKDNCDVVVCFVNEYGMKYGYHKHMIHESSSGRLFIRKAQLRIYLDTISFI